MLFHNSLFYCLLILPAAMCFGASVESPDPNTAVNTTTDAPSEQQDVEHSTTNRVVYHSPANQQVSQSVCENDIKATNQEVWELRQQVQMLKLKQDMTNLRSEMKDLTGHVTCGQPRPDPGDTVTNAQQTTAAAQSDPVTQPITATARSAYVRWGENSCPDGANLVYSGIVGGGYYSSSGAGANTLCLPLNPVYDSQQPTKWITYLYGSEYDTLPEDTQNLDVVCAVCEIPRPLTIMVPATNTCHPGWTVEYTGYLMAGKDDHAAGTEFICMDTLRRGRIGSNSDHNGKLFYYVLSKCGSLPCPPYEDGKVLMCAVCSK